jgi:hypothetical protein
MCVRLAAMNKRAVKVPAATATRMSTATMVSISTETLDMCRWCTREDSVE